MKARVENHGSVCIFYALDPEAEAWVDGHISNEAQLWGRDGTVVEPRYVGALVEGFINDGGEVQ